jgi:hypothetical protein
MIVKVKVYKHARDYQHDGPKMAAGGWQIVDTAGFQPRRSIPGLVFIPFALFRAPKGQFTVTYGRESEYPDTFAGRMQEATAHLNARKVAQEQHIADVKAADPTSRIAEQVGPKWMGIRRIR